MSGFLSIPTFTNLGYLWHSRDFEPVTTDMSGKTVLITGGSGGLGAETAVTLAGLGAQVIAVARSEDDLNRLSVRAGGRITPLPADLSLLSEVRRVADEVASTQSRLDVLINNVGVLLPDRQVTTEGIEKTLAINLAGHFLLTNMLLPLIEESAPARIINVSSGGMYSTPVRPDDLQYEKGEYRGALAYARTKRGQVVLTEMWGKALKDTGVVVHAMHPGWAKTGGVSAGLPTFDKLMRPLLRNAAQGADTIVWLAADPEPARSTGQFWFDREPAPTHLRSATRSSEAKRQELWDRLAELTGWSAQYPT